jgi:hypothetical protein
MSETITQPAGAAQATYTVGAIAAADFAVPFQFDAATDLAVFIDGIRTTAFTLTATTEVQGIYTAATVRLNTPVTSCTVTINRATALAQSAVFPASGAFNVAALNRELARLWQAMQDTAALAGRSLRVDDHEVAPGFLPDAADRAGFILAFDAQGQPTLTTLSLNNQALSATGQAVAFAVSPAAARSALAAAPTAAPSFTGGITVTGGATIDNALPAAVHGGPVAGLRNRIINGGMAVDQRYGGTQATIAPPGAYALDRWLIVPAGGNALVQRVAGASAGRFYMEVKRGGVGVVSLTIHTRLEAQQVADLVGQRATLAFAAFPITGEIPLTVTVVHANVTNNFSATTLIATTTLTSGSLGLDPPPARLAWTLPDTLPAGAANGLQVSIAFTTGLAGGLKLGDVQLEGGTVATPFEHRPFAVEQAMAQRYYEAGEGSIEVQAAGRWAQAVFFATSKRATPLVVTTSLGTPTNLTGNDVTAFAMLNGFRARHTFGGAGAREFLWVADAEL